MEGRLHLPARSVPIQYSQTIPQRGQDSPLWADVLFSKAWHTANRRPAWGEERKGKRLSGLEGRSLEKKRPGSSTEWPKGRPGHITWGAHCKRKMLDPYSKSSKKKSVPLKVLNILFFSFLPRSLPVLFFFFKHCVILSYCNETHIRSTVVHHFYVYSSAALSNSGCCACHQGGFAVSVMSL